MRSFARRYGPHFAIALLTGLAVRFQAVPAVLHGALQDPDSYMRLVRMQEALDAGHWFGSIVSRDASGAGVVLPWSHLLDALILLLRAPLRLALPPEQALFWAAVATGPLLLGTLGAACAWAAAPLTPRNWLWTAPLAAAISPAILNYGELGCVTHHIALAALVVLAWGAGGRAAFGGLGAGAALGAFTGLGIWLSPEAMPYCVMALGGVLLSWAVQPRPEVADACLASGASLLAVLAAGLAIDPPFGGVAAAALDRLSLPFLCLGGVMAALTWLPRRLGGGPASRFAVLGGAALAGAAGWLALFPGFLHGLAGLMTAEQAAAFFGPIREMAPLTTPGLFTLFASAGSLAALAALVLAMLPAQPPLARVLWLYAGACLAGCVGIAVLHVRFSSYPAAAAATMLPVLLGRLATPGVLAWRPVLRPALLMAFLCGPGLLGRSLVSSAQADETASLSAYAAECPVAAASTLLAPYAGWVVLAQINDGPELLYRSRVAIVGSLYHPNIAGFMRSRAAWRAQALAQPPPELLATGARAVLICPHHARMASVDGPAATLLDRLNAGDPPAWLVRVAGGTGSNWVLYRLERNSMASPEAKEAMP